MAQVDPSIAMGFRPIQIESPINQMAALSQLQGLQQQQQMNALKMQEYQRGTEQRNALARIHADPNVKIGSPEYLSRVAAEAPTLYEEVAGRAAAQAKLAEDIESRKQRNFESKLKLYQSFIPRVNTVEGVTQVVSAMYKDPDLKDTLEQIMPYEVALTSNQDAFNQDPESWKLSTAGTSAKDIIQMQRDALRAKNEAARLELEDARARETQRHQQAMEDISKSGVDRQQKQLEETQRHHKVMEGIDAHRVNITAAAEARKAEQGETPLSNKEIQKREAVRPQATAAIKGIEAKSESFINDLKALRDHPGLSQITGLIAGRAPAITKEGRAAQALYDKILAKGGFEMLQQMREASKTGGALGNVSNQEGKQLQASFAAIDRRQDAADVKKALDTAISDVEGARARSREAFSETYSYREQRGEPAMPAPTPAAPKPPAVGTVQDGYRFKGGNPADQKNWEKVK